MNSGSTRLRLDELLPLVYDQLRRYASRVLDNEQAGVTLQTTDLVHEVFLRLSQLHSIRWEDDRQIMRTAVGAMRRILVDHARARKALKRTPADVRMQIPAELLADPSGAVRPPDLLDLDAALTKLAAIDQRKAEVVELRFLGGFSVEEVAAMLGVSEPTIKRDWALARAWLYRELNDEPDPGE